MVILAKASQQWHVEIQIFLGIIIYNEENSQVAMVI